MADYQEKMKKMAKENGKMSKSDYMKAMEYSEDDYEKSKDKIDKEYDEYMKACNMKKSEDSIEDKITNEELLEKADEIIEEDTKNMPSDEELMKEIDALLENNEEVEKAERSDKERQIIDNAVQDIHTDKKQVQDVLKEVPKKLQDDVLKELRRRGKDLYPEKGPSGKGEGPDLKGKYDKKEVKKSENLSNKENIMATEEKNQEKVEKSEEITEDSKQQIENNEEVVEKSENTEENGVEKSEENKEEVVEKAEDELLENAEQDDIMEENEVSSLDEKFDILIDCVKGMNDKLNDFIEKSSKVEPKEEIEKSETTEKDGVADEIIQKAEKEEENRFEKSLNETSEKLEKALSRLDGLAEENEKLKKELTKPASKRQSYNNLQVVEKSSQDTDIGSLSKSQKMKKLEQLYKGGRKDLGSDIIRFNSTGELTQKAKEALSK